DPHWPVLYAEEHARVMAVLGDLVVVSIEHIGSTSVPDLSAKPIIDLLLTVSSLGPADPFIEPLGNLGYTFFAALGNNERHMFARGRPHTHHLHIVQHLSDEHQRPLAFRNYLRSNADTAQTYVSLKRAL